MSNNDPFPFGPMEPDDCIPNKNPFGDFEGNDFPINIPTVFMPIQPSMLEVLKALRECFAATNGRVPTGPLDTLIAKYDFTVSMETTLDGEQLEANRNIPPSNEFGGTGGMDPDDEPHEKNGFGD